MMSSDPPIKPGQRWCTIKLYYLFCLFFLVGCDSLQSNESGAAASTHSSPTGVYASPGTGTGKIILQWAADKEVGSYNIYMSTTPGVRDNKYRSKSKSTKPVYIFSGLTHGKTYYFTVSAKYGSVESQMSGEVSATAP